MATTWKTITVRIERPPEVSLAEFFAVLRSWLDHHCIMLADLRGKSEVFDALFDNPRVARLFELQFAAQLKSGARARIDSRPSVSATKSSKAAPALGSLVPIGNTA